MVNKNEHFRRLFRKYVNNQYSEKELKELVEWLKTDQAQDNTNDITQELWNRIPLKYQDHSSEKNKELQKESLLLIKADMETQKKKIRFSFKTIYKIAEIALLFIVFISEWSGIRSGAILSDLYLQSGRNTYPATSGRFDRNLKCRF